MKHKQFAKHEKLFNSGIDRFNQGLNAPSDINSPEYFGWNFAKEVKEIKSRWLQISREKYGVS